MLELDYDVSRAAGPVRLWVRRFGMGGVPPDQWHNAPSNRLTTLNLNGTAYNYVFDDNGNLRQQNLDTFHGSDHADRMITYRVQAGASPSVDARYLYGADGIRVKKWIRNSGGQIESTVYVDEVFEYHNWLESGDPTPKQNNYLHVIDGQSRVAVVRSGDHHSRDAGPPIQYHLGDHLGSNGVTLDEGGAWMNREEFFPYGETSLGSFAKKRFRFTGKERDEESGLSYHNARYYALPLGRWCECDPHGSEDDQNLYAFVHSNPIRWIDPEGTERNDPPSGEAAASTPNPDLDKTKSDPHQPNIVSPFKQVIKGAAQTMDPSGKALSGTYNLWSGGAQGQAQAAAAPGCTEAKTLEGTQARATVEAWIKQGKYPPAALDNPSLLSRQDFEDVWINTSSRLATKAALSDTPVTDIHPNARGWVKTNYELPRVAGFGALSAGLSFAGAAVTSYQASQIKNELVQTTGLVAASVESTGAVTYGLGALLPNSSLMATGAGMIRVGGGVGVTVVSGYYLTQDIKTGDVTRGVGDAAGTATGVLMLAGAGPAASVTGAFAVGYGVGTVINTYAVGPLIDKAAPGCGSLGDWYYRNFLK